MVPIGKKREGDVASLVLLRDGAETPVEITFFRMPKKKPHQNPPGTGKLPGEEDGR
jgi:hypothetical protein